MALFAQWIDGQQLVRGRGFKNENFTPSIDAVEQAVDPDRRAVKPAARFCTPERFARLKVQTGNITLVVISKEQAVFNKGCRNIGSGLAGAYINQFGLLGIISGAGPHD